MKKKAWERIAGEWERIAGEWEQRAHAAELELQEWRSGRLQPDPPELEERACRGRPFLHNAPHIEHVDILLQMDTIPCAAMTGCSGHAWRGITWPAGRSNHVVPCGGALLVGG
jgi:hypothetical protein